MTQWDDNGLFPGVHSRISSSPRDESLGLVYLYLLYISTEQLALQLSTRPLHPHQRNARVLVK